MDVVARARELRKTIEGLAENLTDAEGLENVELFAQYEVGKDYAIGDRFQYNGELYKVLQAHTSQADWVPGTGTESLYVRVDDIHAGTADDPIPYNGNMELVENLYYTQGGVLYRCTRSTGTAVYNALSELVGLYVEVVTSGTEEPTEPEEPTGDEVAEWVQPTGAQDAYDVGDRVSHNGMVWECTSPSNVYEPGVYGWVVVTE